MAKPQYGAAHKRRRASWETELHRLGSIDCGCNGECGRHAGRCPTTIRPGDAWHLGHGLAHDHGGDGTDSTPWCSPCNTTHGARIAHRTLTEPPSGDWW